jgi:hypothetical protein
MLIMKYVKRMYVQSVGNHAPLRGIPMDKILPIPKNLTEYRNLIWAFCRECCGRKRDVAGDCTKTDCKLFPVFSMPRTVVIKFDYSEHIKGMIEAALYIANKYGAFQVSSVRRRYYEMTGNGASLNWGRLTQRREWLELFDRIGNEKSMNLRSHGDTVALWKKKIN